MKKYIIISGVPRAGKSTVSKLLAKQFGYQHLSMDSVLAGIESVFPETGIHTDAETDELENIMKISGKLAPFIQRMIDSGEYDECDYGVVIDVYQLLPEDYVQYIDSSVCEIHYFLTSDVTPEERYAILKQYDTPADYTYYKSEVENYRSCTEMVEVSRLIKEQCGRFHLPCYETAYNRKKVIKDFVGQMQIHSNVRYITATEAQTDAVFSLVQDTIKSVYPKYYPMEVVDFFCELHSKEAISNDIKKGIVGILLNGDGTVVGTGSYEENQIMRIYVPPMYQGRGYGTCIMEELEKRIAKEYQTAYLDASLPACALYEHRGYKTLRHEKRNIKNGIVFVWEIMEKKLR